MGFFDRLKEGRGKQKYDYRKNRSGIISRKD